MHSTKSIEHDVVWQNWNSSVWNIAWNLEKTYLVKSQCLVTPVIENTS